MNLCACLVSYRSVLYNWFIAMFKISAMVYMFNAIIQQQTWVYVCVCVCVCCLPQIRPIIASLKTAMASTGTPPWCQKIWPYLTIQNGRKWMKNGWKICWFVKPVATQIWANRTRMDQAWVIRTSAFPLPPLISSAREQAMLRAVRMAFLMATYKSCQELVKYQKHLEIQRSSLKRMKQRR